jgi:soluble lytic murein transglycosylase-like protein
MRAMVQVESLCDVRALSPKGAMGLMQIMPAFGSNDA